MIKNYLLISFRNLRKHFSYSLINIFGLSVGLATCLLLSFWIAHELSYDKFHEQRERIYRASLEYGFGGLVSKTPVSPSALLPALLTLPETETGVRVYNPSAYNPYIIKKGENLFPEKKFYVADSTFFDVFSFKLIKGNPKTALTEPYNLVLTESTARKYFGDEDPLGKTLFINNATDYLITGVMEDAPSNSLMKFDFVASFSSIRAGRENPIWWSANYQTFVLLNNSASVRDLETKINDIAMKAVSKDLSGSGDYVKYNFIKMSDIYLRSDVASEPEVVSSIKYVYIFSAIAVLILLIACINYVNLATARAADRAKEVGIRKVVGALQKQLLLQFIGESIIITFLAFFFAFLISQLFLPIFNQVTGKNFGFFDLLAPQILVFAIIGLLVISILSGAYPALAITSFKPVSVLKGNFKTSGRGVWLRKSLVVFQFAVSVILITGTIIIIKQLNYIQGKRLGYDKENTIVLPLDRKTTESYEALKTELMRTQAVARVARGSESPVTINAGYSIGLHSAADRGIITGGLQADEEYLPALGIELLQGRNFTEADLKRVETDTVYTYILNETALKTLYIAEKTAIGTKVSMGGSRPGEIIGVVKDFHFASLHRDINPLIIFPEAQNFNKVFVKLNSGDVTAHLEQVRKAYSSVIAHRPFEYQFLDEQYQALYTNERRMSAVFVVFATLAIIIACLGLLGLVSFTAAQKTKEIGIRKVLGAKASNIIILITRDFTQLVAIAMILGIPLAYWVMSQWLDSFAYRTGIGALPVVIAILICFAIAIASAGYQALKAAWLDPAKTLRNE